MKVKPILNFLVQKWWAIYAISIALFVLWAIVAVFGPPTPKPADDVVFYPWIIMEGKASIFAVIGLGGAIAGCVLYALKRKTLATPVILAAGTLVCWIAALALLGPILFPINFDWPLTHVESRRTNIFTYNLARYSTFEIGWSYILYECDTLGITCRAIYHYGPQSLDYVYADNAENPPHISLDETGIAVYIAGAIVHTYPIPTENK